MQEGHGTRRQDFALDSNSVLNNLAATRELPCRIDVLNQPDKEELDAGFEVRFGLPDGVWVIAGAALAQEGYPLKGSWLGDYGPNKTTRTQVFLVMDWDGKSISGMINPGTDNIPIKNATLTPPTPPPPGPRGGGGGTGVGEAVVAAASR